ncbi:DUF4245 domain-containing protein [Streptomyces sp. I05A-00742]|uniref:DUF4245 domain-containing protein n=1 Tax=Streptomyces sp. I05A-00742 TaxID=2732853 RepID=UPI001488316B|nr:DUF4245 domain-containing protein [Streptomyces sp. I05A-00742]
MGGVAGRNGKNQTVRNMLLSLAVVVPVAGTGYLLLPHEGSGRDPVKTVDYRVELLSARRAAPYPVAAPEGLGTDWRATSVWYRAGERHGNGWHLGFVDPDTEYVEVDQSDGPALDFIEDSTQGAEKTGKTQRVGDRVWQRYQGEKYNALVRTERGVTTVVAGTASDRRLTEMAAALRDGKAKS